MQPEPDPTSTVPGMNVWGWQSVPELQWLIAQAARMDSVVEIGCLHGRSAFALLTACAGPVYCVDPWNDDHDKSFPSFMGSCGHFPNLRPVRAYSPGCADRVPDVDMTFIDGSHAYGSVLADIAAWLPKTRRLICGHDYQNQDAGYPGVAQAVHEVFGDRVTCAQDTSIWAVDLEDDRSISSLLEDRVIEQTDEYGVESRLDIRWHR